MARYAYTGDQRVIYSHYLDVSKPDAATTLVPEPGKTYEIKQADSPRVIQPDGQFTDQELPMPPDDNWRETKDPTWAEVEAEEAKKAEQAAGGEAKPGRASKKETGTDA